MPPSRCITSASFATSVSAGQRSSCGATPAPVGAGPDEGGVGMVGSDQGRALLTVASTSSRHAVATVAASEALVPGDAGQSSFSAGAGQQRLLDIKRIWRRSRGLLGRVSLPIPGTYPEQVRLPEGVS